MKIGKVLSLSSPSGNGKTQSVTRLRKDFPLLWYSISCTDRDPREVEVNEVDYHFVTKEKFASQKMCGHFLEHTRYEGSKHLYGTPRKPLIDTLRSGINALLDIDVDGVRQIKCCQIPLITRNLKSVFIIPGNLDDLRQRLVDRGTSTAEIKSRMAAAEQEIAKKYLFDHVITNKNGQFDTMYAELHGIARSWFERKR